MAWDLTSTVDEAGTRSFSGSILCSFGVVEASNLRVESDGLMIEGSLSSEGTPIQVSGSLSEGTDRVSANATIVNCSL